MPHLNIEYSSNLEDRVDIGQLCRRMLREVLATGLFEVGAVRVRAFGCAHYAVADDLPANAFVDMSFRIGAGRSLDERRQAGEAVFKAAVEELQALLETQHFALSLEIREIDPALSWKKNAMHQRLRRGTPRKGAEAAR